MAAAICRASGATSTTAAALDIICVISAVSRNNPASIVRAPPGSRKSATCPATTSARPVLSIASPSGIKVPISTSIFHSTDA